MNTSNASSSDACTDDILCITSQTINLVLGAPINSWVLWLVLTGPAGTMTSEILTLNLSAFEIIFRLLSLILFIKPSRLFQMFTVGFLFTGRPVFQTCICVERFVAVVHPVLFLKYKPLRYRAACSAVAWLLIVASSLVRVLLAMFDNEEIVYYVNFGSCLFFMSVMLLCSLAVLRALKQPAPGDTTGRERDHSLKRRAFAIICLIMVSFMGTFLMWGLIAILISQGHISEDATLIRRVCMFITVLTGLVQPLLYLRQKTGKLPCIKPIHVKDPQIDTH